MTPSAPGVIIATIVVVLIGILFWYSLHDSKHPKPRHDVNSITRGTPGALGSQQGGAQQGAAQKGVLQGAQQGVLQGAQQGAPTSYIDLGPVYQNSYPGTWYGGPPGYPGPWYGSGWMPYAGVQAHGAWGGSTLPPSWRSGMYHHGGAWGGPHGGAWGGPHGGAHGGPHGGPHGGAHGGGHH